MIDNNNDECVHFGRRKSDIHHIKVHSDNNYITTKHALEQLLRAKLQEFRRRLPDRKKGYRSLHEYIAEHFYTQLTANNMDEKKADHLISQCVPSHTSLRNFLNGDPLGMKYLDCIAYVFDVKYIFTNFGLDTFIEQLQTR